MFIYILKNIWCPCEMMHGDQEGNRYFPCHFHWYISFTFYRKTNMAANLLMTFGSLLIFIGLIMAVSFCFITRKIPSTGFRVSNSRLQHNYQSLRLYYRGIFCDLEPTQNRSTWHSSCIRSRRGRCHHWRNHCRLINLFCTARNMFIVPAMQKCLYL